MRQYSAAISRIKKTAKTISAELKVPLFEAQDIAAQRLTGKSFVEVTLHAKGEAKRDLEDRQSLLSEVAAFIEAEHSPYSNIDPSKNLTFKRGSPLS